MPFYPRLTEDGLRTSPYYTTKNVYYNNGWGMPNCTAYAWGRTWEIYGANADWSNPPTLSTRDAEDWYPYTQDGYQRSQTPQLGAIWCGADGDFSGWGHVGVVEEIDAVTGDLTISSSALNGYFFQLNTITRSSGYQWPYGNYRFQGFILNPNPGGGGPIPPPGPGGNFKIWMAKKQIFRKRGL